MPNSDSLLKKIINHVADPIFVKDRKHRWIEGNSALWNLMGKSEAEMLGKSDYDFFPKEEADVFWQKDEEVFTTGQPNINIENFTDASGVTHVISTKKSCFQHNNQLILVGVIRDITELTRIQEKLNESNVERIKSIMEHFGCPVYIKDLEGRYIYANHKTLGGRSHQDVIGLTDYDLYPENAETYRMNDRLVMEKGQAIECEEPVTHPDGPHKYASVKFPLYDANDKIYAICGVSTDITERTQSEKSKALLAAVVESSYDAIISHTLDGIVTSWNTGAERLFGYSAAEVVGQHKHLVIPQKLWQEEEECIAQLYKGVPVKQFETARIDKDGNIINVAVTISAIRDSAGKMIGISKVAHDITHRKSIEAQLKQSLEEISAAKKVAEDANRVKGEFLANFSHEIRTPMNAIMGIANILATYKNISSEKYDNFVGTLKMSAESLMELINDMLDMSKIENGLMHLENTVFELNLLIENVIKMMSVRAETQKISLTLDYDKELYGEFLGDVTRIRQVLLNMISNAIKFTEHGTITIRVRPHINTLTYLQEACIEVIDTGIGIPEDKLDMIFKKFSQADTSITRKYGGTGLGLTITKMLVDLMGGRIAVKSQVSMGSTFSIYLPLIRPIDLYNLQDKIHDNSESLNLGAVKEKPRVLLVEDYQPNILVATTLLERMGYHYETALHGQEAIDKLFTHSFDIILMDIQMPVMDGYTTTQKIRELEKEQGLSYMPIIGMTAHALNNDRQRCLEIGMDDYISKPFNPTDLDHKIRSLIHQNSKLTSETYMSQEPLQLSLVL